MVHIFPTLARLHIFPTPAYEEHTLRTLLNLLALPIACLAYACLVLISRSFWSPCLCSPNMMLTSLTRFPFYLNLCPPRVVLAYTSFAWGFCLPRPFGRVFLYTWDDTPLPSQACSFRGEFLPSKGPNPHMKGGICAHDLVHIQSEI